MLLAAEAFPAISASSWDRRMTCRACRQETAWTILIRQFS